LRIYGQSPKSVKTKTDWAKSEKAKRSQQVKYKAGGNMKQVNDENGSKRTAKAKGIMRRKLRRKMR